MTSFDFLGSQRRQFLRTVSGLAAGAFGAMPPWADDLPQKRSE